MHDYELGLSQGTSALQQTGAQDGKEAEGGDDAGGGREAARGPVQRAGTKLHRAGVE